MKTKLVTYPIIAASVVFIISCSDIEKSSFDKSLPETKEKKEFPPPEDTGPVPAAAPGAEAKPGRQN